MAGSRMPPRRVDNSKLVAVLERGRQKAKAAVPINIERVLLMAAGDTDFRIRLLGDRDAVLADRSLGLTPDETAIMEALPVESLVSMIDKLDLEKRGYRRIMRRVAEAASGGSAPELDPEEV